MRTGCWWENLIAKDHLEDLGVDGRMIFKCVFKLQNGGSWTGLIWLRMGQMAGSLKNGNDYSGFIKYEECLQ